MKFRLRDSLAHVFALTLAAGLTSSLAVRDAHATWPHDPNNGNLPVCTATSDQYIGGSIPDGAGGTIIVWQDLRSAVRIYVQKLNAAGVPQWTADGVPLTTVGGGAQFPVIISDGAGGAVITWQDLRTSNYDVYAQRVNAAGVLQWGVNGVAVCTAANDATAPRLAPDGTGGAIITWQDYRTSISISHIYAQRVNGAGVPQWTTDGLVVCNAANSQYSPTIASDAVGGAIISWYDTRGATQDIYAQRVNAAGAMLWTLNGSALCNAANSQQLPVTMADGAGGAIVAWQDARNSNFDVYAQRLSPSGAQLWTSNGLAVSATTSDQVGPVLASDGSGGAIFAWSDFRSGVYDIYAQHVNAGGTPLWTANGIGLCTAAGQQGSPTIAGDGMGGAIVAWSDPRNGVSDIYAQRVTSAGSPMWPANGVAVCAAALDQSAPQIVSDGLNGALIAWQDVRSGVSYDIYAQRIEPFGYLGNPEPVSAGVRDVANDQGGKVRVAFAPTWLDSSSDPNLAAYDIFRSAPVSLAAAAMRSGAHRLARFGEVPPAGARGFVIPDAASIYAWEFVGTVTPLHFLPTYGFIASTTCDSLPGSNPRTPFMIVARNSSGSMYWLSAPDSGYSVDNIGPAAPAPFVASYAAGATHLHWGVNHEADLAGYLLYRGAAPSFVPGPGNLVSSQADTGCADPGAAGSWYKLAAVDVHGNVSVYAIVGPATTLDAPGATPATLFFAPPAPNPAGRNGAMLRFGLAAEAHVTLALFDQQGRRVRELANGVLPAGEHALRWDGRDDAGRAVAAGLYFARLDAGSQHLVTRVVRVD